MRPWLLLLLLACPPLAARAAEGPRPKVLAVICYHRFGTETEADPYRISLERLDGQLDWLVQDGWSNVTLAQVDAGPERTGNQPAGQGRAAERGRRLQGRRPWRIPL